MSDSTRDAASTVRHMQPSESSGQAAEKALTLTLRQVRKEFPQFVIWRETVMERTRFISRSRDLGTRPHTVITDDLAELRDVLAGRPARQPAPARPPNVARMYSYLTSGKDHLLVDRQAVESLLAGFPEVAHIAKANREFVTGAVARVAAQGVAAFIDIGAGLPASLNVHEVAQHVNPSAVTCYVDSDEVVVTHARALLAGGPWVTVVQSDLRHPDAIVTQLAAAIDLARPVCLILASVLHFLTADEADAVVAVLKDAVVPGSYLVISAGTCTGTSPALLERLQEVYAASTLITARPEPDIMAWFDGWHLLPPGLPDVRDLRIDALPRLPPRHPPVRAARFLAGIGRKPVPAVVPRQRSEAVA